MPCCHTIIFLLQLGPWPKLTFRYNHSISINLIISLQHELSCSWITFLLIIVSSLIYCIMDNVFFPMILRSKIASSHPLVRKHRALWCICFFLFCNFIEDLVGGIEFSWIYPLFLLLNLFHVLVKMLNLSSYSTIMFVSPELLSPILGYLALFKDEESHNYYSMCLEGKNCKTRTTKVKNGMQNSILSLS